MVRILWNRLLHKIAYTMPGGDKCRPFLHRLRGVKIGENVWISQYVYIDELHPEAVTIGRNCSLGLRSSIFTHFYWGPRRSTEQASPVVIEEDVFVGPHCVILPNVIIGRGSVIKAGSVVTGHVPPHTFWGPPPSGPLAQVTVPLTAAHEYDQFLQGLRPLRKKA